MNDTTYEERCEICHYLREKEVVSNENIRVYCHIMLNDYYNNGIVVKNNFNCMFFKPKTERSNG